MLAALGVMRFPAATRDPAATGSALYRQIPETISLVLRAVRAGLPVSEAVRSIAREEILHPVARRIRAGQPARRVGFHSRASSGICERTELREFAFFAVTLGLQGQTGGNLSETLDNLSPTSAAARGHGLQGGRYGSRGARSAAVLAGLPFATGLLRSWRQS